MIKYSILILTTVLLIVSCDDTLKCERHFLPKGFIGIVTIYYDHANGLKEIDKEGCYTYQIPRNGEYYSGFPYKKGTTIPNKTWKYFELDENSLVELKEFDKYEYLNDSSYFKGSKKYIYFLSSGYQNHNSKTTGYNIKYAVDFGINYIKYVPN